MTAVPRPTTILKPRPVSPGMSAELSPWAPRPEMISASLGSATRQTSLKAKTRTISATTAAPAMVRIEVTEGSLQSRGVGGVGRGSGTSHRRGDEDDPRLRVGHDAHERADRDRVGADV